MDIVGHTPGGLEVTDLVKEYGPDRAIDGISFQIAEHEVVALLGPSGCGKTTTLRSVAGLETPTSGSIVLAGKTLFSSAERIDVMPEKRGIGLVFQSYALWPHLTVFENVAYGLRVARVRKDELVERVEAALASVELSPLARRYPATLSGGQQQRVALARSLVMRPRMLLFDEPLSNLDLKLRESMRQDLRQVMKETGLTCLYVTHDQAEAMVIADRMIVMRDGGIEQEGTPQGIYSRPASEFTASFVGSVNLLPVSEVEQQGGDLLLHLANGLRLCKRHTSGDPVEGVRSAVVRPEWIRLVAENGSAANALPATVQGITFLGNVTYYDVDVNGLSLRVQSGSADHAEGDAVTVVIPPERIGVVTR